MRCLDFDECSARADFAIRLWLVSAMCSFILASKDRLVCPIYEVPQEQGILYTPDCWRGLILSFTDMKDCLRVLSGLKTVLMFFLMRILAILSVFPWIKWRKAREIGGWESRWGLGKECFAL